MIVYLGKYLNTILYFQIIFLIVQKQVMEMDDWLLKMAGGIHSSTSVNGD
jgi:hypothetical protein